MDDIEELDKQQIDKYIDTLEATITNLADKLKKVQVEKQKLFNNYVNSLYELFNIKDIKEE